MKDLCQYFTSNTQYLKEYHMSISGKLEAIVGNYLVSGEGNPEEILYAVYFDASVDSFYNAVECREENLIAVVTSDYAYAFVLDSMLDMFCKDTKEYGITYIPVTGFEKKEFMLSKYDTLPEFMSNVRWIRDDFLYDDSIEFDFVAFEEIDNGTDYLNPDHFSVKELVYYIQRHRNVLA